jgi:hypothetical protein
VSPVDIENPAVLSTPVSKLSTRVGGIPWQWQIVVFLAAALIVFSRRPDAFLNAQFYAEDGRIWFAQAYNDGWFASLFRPDWGYYSTYARIAAALALAAPLAWAPFVMNITGMVAQILPVPILLSSRLTPWGSLSFRGALALIYLALPNSAEVNVTVEESQWHLAVSAALLLLSRPPKSTAWKAFDAVVIALFGLSSPLCIVLLGVAAAYSLIRRRMTAVTSGVLLCCVLIQSKPLMNGTALAIRNGNLGATMPLFLQIVTGQVYIGAILGANDLALRLNGLVVAALAATGTLLLVWGLVKSNLEMGLSTAFAAAAFLAALKSPLVPAASPTRSAWEVLAASNAIHYWFLPTLAFAWMSVWYFLCGPGNALRSIGFVLLIFMMIGIIKDWRYRPYADYRFSSYADAFQKLPKGSVVTIPQNPAGWSMQLVKR